MTNFPPGIDHLIFTAATLEQGMDEIEKRLGVRPVPGGRHPDFGTHNALLSLGNSTYLEVMAPDPHLQAPAKGVLFQNVYQRPPGLTTWVYRFSNLQEKIFNVKSSELEIGDVLPGNRQKPDGTVLSWQLTDPYAFPLQGAIPFLIDWGTTLHPATTTPEAGVFQKLRIEHPNPDRVKAALMALDIQMDVAWAPEYRLVATIITDLGEVLLF
jgi:hypothetical protein